MKKGIRNIILLLGFVGLFFSSCVLITPTEHHKTYEEVAFINNSSYRVQVSLFNSSHNLFDAFTLPAGGHVRIKTTFPIESISYSPDVYVNHTFTQSGVYFTNAPRLDDQRLQGTFSSTFSGPIDSNTYLEETISFVFDGTPKVTLQEQWTTYAIGVNGYRYLLDHSGDIPGDYDAKTYEFEVKTEGYGYSNYTYYRCRPWSGSNGGSSQVWSDWQPYSFSYSGDTLWLYNWEGIAGNTLQLGK